MHQGRCRGITTLGLCTDFWQATVRNFKRAVLVERYLVWFRFGRIAIAPLREVASYHQQGALLAARTSLAHDRMSDSDDGDDDDDDGRPILGVFQLPLLAAGQAESSDDDDDDAAPLEAASNRTRSPQSAPAGPSSAADEPVEDEAAEASLLPSAEDALEDDAAGAFLKVSHSVDVPAMQGFEDPSEAAARKPSTGAEKAALYSENAAKCLAARDQAPSANRKRKPGSEAVDGGHFRSEANARKNSGKVKGEFKKRPERQREH